MAGVWLLPTVVTIILSIATGVVIFVVLRWNKRSREVDVKPNSTIIDTTSRQQFTDGYTLGIVKREVLRPNGTVFIEMVPLDSDQDPYVDPPKSQTFIVHKDMLARAAPGEMSGRRARSVVLPRHSAELPKVLRETDVGKSLGIAGQRGYLERVFGKSIPAGDQAIDEILNEHSRVGITRTNLAQLRELNSEMMKLQARKSLVEEERKSV